MYQVDKDTTPNERLRLLDGKTHSQSSKSFVSAALLRKCSKVNKCFNSSVFNFFSSADGFCSEHGVTFEATIIDKFEVAFGTEGETLSLGCTVIIYPTVKNYQPEVVWYRDCK